MTVDEDIKQILTMMNYYEVFSKEYAKLHKEYIHMYENREYYRQYKALCEDFFTYMYDPVKREETIKKLTTLDTSKVDKSKVQAQAPNVVEPNVDTPAQTPTPTPVQAPKVKEHKELIKREFKYAKIMSTLDIPVLEKPSPPPQSEYSKVVSAFIQLCDENGY